MDPDASHSALPPNFPPREIWIMGAGHFGRLAAKRLRRRYPEASMLVADLRVEKLEEIRRDFGAQAIVQDAVGYLAQNDFSDSVWIIPAVPVHLAFQWMLIRLGTMGRATPLAVPEAVDALVPNPYRAGGGALYASFATFRCPDACDEPDTLCTYTKKPRQGSLFEHLGRMHVPGLRVIVVRSWQLAPGVGGYPGGYLKGTLDRIASEGGDYLIATACRCHGVIDGLRWIIG